MSDSSASVSTLIERVKEGDKEAAARLWDRYFRRLLGLARKRLVALRRRGAADEDDVVNSAFHDFCRAVRGDRYAELHGRESLWRVLAAFVANKAKTLVDHENAAKRRVEGESALPSVDGGSSGQERGLGRVPSPDPGPDVEVELKERFKKFLDGLSDEEREIACLRMEGHNTKEIAARIKVSAPTVRRRLAIIRAVLTQELGDGRGH